MKAINVARRNDVQGVKWCTFTLRNQGHMEEPAEYTAKEQRKCTEM
jgi:hypothetical protein